MVRTRQDIWKLGPSWSDTTLWYAKGVAELLKRPITRADSWLFLAAMHGFDASTWKSAGYISDLTAPASSPSEWDQCPHRSSYFLPWNRVYLAAFEAIVRDAIVQLGGPDNWALPYWNYSDQSNPNARKLPPVFAEKTLPDRGVNPLFVSQRNGAGGGLIVLTPNDVDLGALLEDSFEGASDGSSPGFGGASPFPYDGSSDIEGLVEQAPHDIVHCRIGGRGGLMSSPGTAALDPIFWVHHANIDRLWEVWRRRAPDAHKDPSDLNWLQGPIKRTFVAPRPGGVLQHFAAKDMVDTTPSRLDYTYEDVSDPFSGVGRAEARAKRLAIREPLATHLSETFAPGPKPPIELIGSLDAQTIIEGGVIGVSINLNRKTIAKLRRSFELFAETRQEPDRVYLNLQNIRGLNDAAIFDLYVDLPKNTVPNDQPDYLGGVVSLFGVSRQSRVDGRSSNGFNKIIDITSVVDRMYVGGQLRRDTLSIQIVPTSDIRPEDRISIGRISIYRRRG